MKTQVTLNVDVKANVERCLSALILLVYLFM